VARQPKRTVRLPSGKYVRRGRAVRFGKLSKRQQHLWRVFWGKKGARTWKAHQAALVRDVIISESAVLDGEMRRQGMRSFVAYASSGHKMSEYIEALGTAGHELAPEGKRGSYLMVLEWPDDDRGTKRKPYTTRVSRTYSNNLKYAKQRAKGWFKEVIEAPQALGRFGDPVHPSRGWGKPVLKSVYYMLYPERKARKRRTQDRTSKRNVRRRRS
jgi:hypothetical protein